MTLDPQDERSTREIIAAVALHAITGRYAVPFDEAAIALMVSQAFAVGVQFAKQAKELACREST